MKKKTAKTAKAKKIETAAITMVVDESGSMTHLFDATVAGFNEYVASLKRDLGKQPAFFSAITFDSIGIRKHQTGAPLKDAIKLGPDNYRPNAMTPLFDAIGNAIDVTDGVVKKNGAKKVIVVIQTDGQENLSKEFTLQSLKIAIETRQAQGWEFVFIGAGINAFADAQKMGIQAMNTVSYSPDAVGTRAVFRASAQNTASFSTGAAQNMQYSREQSMFAGESADIWEQKIAVAQGKPVKVTVKATVSR